MFNIGDIVTRDLTVVALHLTPAQNTLARIVSDKNINDCYQVEIIDPQTTAYKLGATMWWSVKLMQLAFPREPDWEV
jgi:hypothetical protein